MRSEIIKSQIKKVMSGSSGQRNVSQSEIKNFKCYKPSINEQNLISSKVHCIDFRIEAEKKVLKKLNKQKNGLMQDLLTGKVRVKVDSLETANV